MGGGYQGDTGCPDRTPGPTTSTSSWPSWAAAGRRARPPHAVAAVPPAVPAPPHGHPLAGRAGHPDRPVLRRAAGSRPYPKNDQNLLAVDLPPSVQHLMGTDDLGRDELTEILYAGQTSLRHRPHRRHPVHDPRHGRPAPIAGFFGEWQDQFLMRLTDLFLIVPQLVILAIAIQKFGGTPWVISFVLAAVFWMYDRARRARRRCCRYARRSSSRRRGPRGRRAGASSSRHILPNIIGPIMVQRHPGRGRRHHHRVDPVVPRASACSRRPPRGATC